MLVPRLPISLHRTIRLQSPNYLSFFFNDTATTEIYTLSLHDALPISPKRLVLSWADPDDLADKSRVTFEIEKVEDMTDRKSTRLNSSHGYISYAVFCLKKKNNYRMETLPTQYIRTLTIVLPHMPRCFC